MHARVMLARDGEQMHGRLRIEVADDDRVVVFVNPWRRDIVIDDFTEEAVGHTWSGPLFKQNGCCQGFQGQ